MTKGRAAESSFNSGSVIGHRLEITIPAISSVSTARFRVFVNILWSKRPCPFIQHWAERDGRWVLTQYKDLTETVELVSAPATLPVAGIYDGIKF